LTTFQTYGKNTLEVTFYEKIPARFFIYDENGEVYFFRDLTTSNTKIKVNIARAGTFTTNVNCVVKVLPFDLIDIKIPLPPKEKNFEHEKFIIRLNPNLKGTPARNFYKQGIIEYSPEFLALPFPVRVFIICHELGHMYYHDEEKADFYACKLYLKLGYNGTTAIHSLTDVLNKSSDRNRRRINRLYNILKNR
jgi:hypothetical protein